MAVDLSTYQPPGTYVDEQESTLVTVTGLPPTLLAIVGPSEGYQRAAEQISLGTSPARLVHKGALNSSVTVTRLDTGEVLGTGEYAVSTTGDTNSQDYFTNVVLGGGATTPAGTPVLVEYRYVDPNYYAPKLFTDFDDVKAAYGEPLNLTLPTSDAGSYSAIVSPLSLAAKLAFDNRATQVLLVATTPPPASATTPQAKSAANRASLAAAYSKIAGNYSAGVIVPLTDGILPADAAGVGTDLKNHCENAAADGFPRTGQLGFEPSADIVPTTLLASGGFRSKRLMFNFCAPGGMAYYSGAINRFLALGHQYLSAAAGARLAYNAPQFGLTRQVLAGFSGFSGAPLTVSEKNAYAAAGVTITEVDRTNQVIIRHGLTTDVTSINTREISVVRGRDAMISLLLNGVEQARLIGSPITATTAVALKTVIAGFLEYSVSQGTVAGYADLKVRQQSVDPSVMEVKFSYAPIYPLNYIVISFSINLAAGGIQDLAAA